MAASTRSRTRLRGTLLKAARRMPAAMEREFRSFLGEIEERRQDLIVGDERQPLLFPTSKIPRGIKIGRARDVDA